MCRVCLAPTCIVHFEYQELSAVHNRCVPSIPPNGKTRTLMMRDHLPRFRRVRHLIYQSHEYIRRRTHPVNTTHPSGGHDAPIGLIIPCRSLPAVVGTEILPCTAYSPNCTSLSVQSNGWLCETGVKCEAGQKFYLLFSHRDMIAWGQQH